MSGVWGKFRCPKCGAESYYTDLPEHHEMLKFLKEHFLRVVEHDTTHFKDWNRYWKWISTWEITSKTPHDARKARKILNDLENAGFVHSKRSSNNTRWALNEIEGFKQHEYYDYYEPVTDNPEPATKNLKLKTK